MIFIKYFPDLEQYETFERNNFVYELNFSQVIRTIYYSDQFGVKILSNIEFKTFKELLVLNKSQDLRDSFIDIDKSIPTSLFSDFLDAIKNHCINPETQAMIGIFTLQNPFNSELITYDAVFLFSQRTNIIVIYELSTLNYLVGLKVTDEQLFRVQDRCSILLDAIVIE